MYAQKIKFLIANFEYCKVNAYTIDMCNRSTYIIINTCCVVV